jgi:Cys-tRNA(Pro) deacylase
MTRNQKAEAETPVGKVLASQGIAHRVFVHPGPIRSLEQAAAERGQRPEQVVRSLLFRIAADEFVLVLIAGGQQVAWRALREALGESRLTTASREEVKQVTGYELGAVAPFGLPQPLRVLVDESVLAEKEVSIGSGVRGTTIILRTHDLLRALPQKEIVRVGEETRAA